MALTLTPVTPATFTFLTLTPEGSGEPFANVRRDFQDFAALKAAFATFGALKAAYPA